MTESICRDAAGGGDGDSNGYMLPDRIVFIFSIYFKFDKELNCREELRISTNIRELNRMEGSLPLPYPSPHQNCLKGTKDCFCLFLSSFSSQSHRKKAQPLFCICSTILISFKILRNAILVGSQILQVLCLMSEEHLEEERTDNHVEMLKVNHPYCGYGLVLGLTPQP